jgi:hypothetical protein
MTALSIRIEGGKGPGRPARMAPVRMAPSALPARAIAA